jgi:hypothetical protein
LTIRLAVVHARAANTYSSSSNKKPTGTAGSKQGAQAHQRHWVKRRSKHTLLPVVAADAVGDNLLDAIGFDTFRSM